MKLKLVSFYVIFAAIFTVQIYAQVIQDKESKSHLSREEFYNMCGTPIDYIKVNDVLARQDSMYKEYKKGKKDKLNKITSVPD